MGCELLLVDRLPTWNAVVRRYDIGLRQVVRDGVAAGRTIGGDVKILARGGGVGVDESAQPGHIKDGVMIAHHATLRFHAKRRAVDEQRAIDALERRKVCVSNAGTVAGAGAGIVRILRRDFKIAHAGRTVRGLQRPRNARLHHHGLITVGVREKHPPRLRQPAARRAVGAVHIQSDEIRRIDRRVEVKIRRVVVRGRLGGAADGVPVEHVRPVGRGTDAVRADEINRRRRSRMGHENDGAGRSRQPKVSQKDSHSIGG